MKKNFASQLFGQVQSFNKLDTLTGLDLTTDINPSQYANGFQKSTLFVDNCKTCNMKNFNYKGFDSVDNGDGTYTEWDDDNTWTTYTNDGQYVESSYDYDVDTTDSGNNNSGNNNSGGGFDVNWGDLFTWGVKAAGNYFTTEQQIKLAEQKGEITKSEADKARTDLAKQKATPPSEQKSSIIKAYGLPIAITGVVIIAGIVTYFVVKKKTKQ